MRPRASCQAPGVMVFLGGRVSESAMGVTAIYAGRGRREVLDTVKYWPDIGRHGVTAAGAAGGGGAPLQPVLHAADRRAAPRGVQQPVLTHGGAGPVRAGAPRETDGHRPGP